MDFRDIVFLKVAEKMSFTKAANELFISQPGVSKHIQALEEKYGTNLFTRQGNKIFLTDSGIILQKKLIKIRNIYNETQYEIGKLNQSFTGELKIGASTSISQYFIPKIMAAFHQKYPKIKLLIINGNSEEIEKHLLDNRIDLALLENSSSHQNIQYRDLLTDEIIPIAGKKSLYAKNKTIGIEHIYQIPLVMREKGSGSLQVIENSLKKKNISLKDLQISISLGSTEAIKNFLPEFEGIGFLPLISIENEIRNEQLIPLRIKGFEIKRKFRIALRHGQASSTTKLWIDFLNQYNF